MSQIHSAQWTELGPEKCELIYCHPKLCLVSHRLWGSLSFWISLGFSLYAPTLNHHHQLRTGNMLKDTSQSLFWCSHPVLSCSAMRSSRDAAVVHITHQPKLYYSPTKPWVHPHPTSGTGAPTFPAPPCESNPPHAVFDQRRTETRMFWQESWVPWLPHLANVPLCVQNSGLLFTHWFLNNISQPGCTEWLPVNLPADAFLRQPTAWTNSITRGSDLPHPS